jgi:hypothetical protein
MKPFYHFLDGTALVAVPVEAKNEDKKAGTADLHRLGAKEPFVTGCRLSKEPADGHWCLVEPNAPPSPPEPDKDARIAELEAKVAELEAAAKAAQAANKQKPEPKS